MVGMVETRQDLEMCRDLWTNGRTLKFGTTSSLSGRKLDFRCCDVRIFAILDFQRTLIVLHQGYTGLRSHPARTQSQRGHYFSDNTLLATL